MKLAFFKNWRNQLTKEELELKNFIVKQFKYRPKSITLFLEAFTHKSFVGTTKFNITPNERLEFLGDTILDAIIAEYLFKRFPEFNEGDLTQTKSKLVSRKTLSNIGSLLQLRNYLRYNKNRSINLDGLEGNCLEAIIGAFYLDAGYKMTREIVLTHIFKEHLDMKKAVEQESDFKSKLYIWCQKQHLSLDFKMLNNECVDGTWTYEIMVTINGVNYGKGKGSSKKKAEQEAAKETMNLIGVD